MTKNIRLHINLGEAANVLWAAMVTKTYDVFFSWRFNQNF